MYSNLNKRIKECENDVFRCNAVIDTLSRAIEIMKEGKKKDRMKRFAIKVNDLKIKNQNLIRLYKLEKKKDIIVEKRMRIELWELEEAIIKKFLESDPK